MPQGLTLPVEKDHYDQLSFTVGDLKGTPLFGLSGYVPLNMVWSIFNMLWFSVVVFLILEHRIQFLNRVCFWTQSLAQGVIFVYSVQSTCEVSSFFFNYLIQWCQLKKKQLVLCVKGNESGS